MEPREFYEKFRKTAEAECKIDDANMREQYELMKTL